MIILHQITVRRSSLEHIGWGGVATTHQNFSESVIKTIFSTSSLASKPLSTKGDPKIGVTADKTSAIETVAWRKGIMAQALRREFDEGKSGEVWGNEQSTSTTGSKIWRGILYPELRKSPRVLGFHSSSASGDGPPITVGGMATRAVSSLLCVVPSLITYLCHASMRNLSNRGFDWVRVFVRTD